MTITETLLALQDAARRLAWAEDQARRPYPSDDAPNPFDAALALSTAALEYAAAIRDGVV